MKPTFKITADGADITNQINDRLLSIRITQNAGNEGDTLTISLDDRDQSCQVPTVGTYLRVWLSDGNTDPVDFGRFGVTEVSFKGPPFEMGVSATAAGVSASLRESSTESWHDITVGDLVGKIGARNGLLPIIDRAIASQKIRHEDQTAESDQAFLTRIANKHGLVIKPDNAKLVAVPKGKGSSANDKSLTVTIRLEECISFQATAKTRSAFSSAKLQYQDVTKKGTPTIRSVTVKKGKETIPPPPPGFKRESSKSSGKLPQVEDGKVYTSKTEAQTAGEAKLKEAAQGEYSFSAKLPGNPRITAGGKLKLVGFRKDLSSVDEIVVKSVTHTFSASGYFTDVSCSTPGNENNDFSQGVNGATKNQPGGGSKSLCQSAEALKGMNTTGGPDGGSNACLFAVNKVIRNAGKSVAWGSSVYVPTARDSLAAGAGIRLSGPEPCCIVIFRDNGSPPYPHIGIMLEDGKTIISNSSSRGSFSWVASVESYTAYYGKTPEYWRLK